MADEPENDTALDLETQDAEDAEIEAPEGAQDQEAGDDEELVIEIEGEEPEEEGTPLIRELRQQNREQARELAALRKAQQPKIEVGEKPTLESCEWDEDKFESELTAWHERKRAADNQEADAAQQARIRNEEFARRANTYRAKLEALPMPAEQKQAAEKTVIDTLPELLQSAIITYADDPAKVVVALAKHPAKLQQLAQETDPIRFILAMKDLERNLKVVNRKKPPAPDAENVVRGSAPLSHNADKEEQRLEKEAERTQDFSKLFEYRRAKRKAA